MLKDIKGAEDSISCAKEYLSDLDVASYFLSDFLLPQFTLSLYRLEESMNSGNKAELAGNRKKAIKLGRKTVKISQKTAQERTEALRLMGTYYWLIDKQKRALSWWNKSIEEGERLDARPELSRTYMEVGRRLLEPKSKYKELNGVSAEEYLEKARKMFEEMDLQWDLDELDRGVAYK
jgi:hypothetical protein